MRILNCCVAFYSPMNIRTNTQLNYLFISGLSFIAFYFFYSLVYKIWSIFAFVLLVLLGLVILVVTVQAFVRNNRVALLFGLMIIGVVTANEILKSELLKSEKILEASLIDDFSSIHLTLRKNHEFEITSRYYFGPDEIFRGEYEIHDSKIIFLDSPFENDLIPETGIFSFKYAFLESLFVYLSKLFIFFFPFPFSTF